jgi:hypothetical protein
VSHPSPLGPYVTLSLYQTQTRPSSTFSAIWAGAPEWIQLIGLPLEKPGLDPWHVFHSIDSSLRSRPECVEIVEGMHCYDDSPWTCSQTSLTDVAIPVDGYGDSLRKR